MLCRKSAIVKNGVLLQLSTARFSLLSVHWVEIQSIEWGGLSQVGWLVNDLGPCQREAVIYAASISSIILHTSIIADCNVSFVGGRTGDDHSCSLVRSKESWVLQVQWEALVWNKKFLRVYLTEGRTVQSSMFAASGSIMLQRSQYCLCIVSSFLILKGLTCSGSPGIASCCVSNAPSVIDGPTEELNRVKILYILTGAEVE